MDKFKYLILKKYDKTKEVKDITDDVESIELSGQKRYVKYKNNPTVYEDNSQRIHIYRNPSLELNGKALFCDGTPIGDYLTALKFDNHVKIIFKKFYIIMSYFSKPIYNQFTYIFPIIC